MTFGLNVRIKRICSTDSEFSFPPLIKWVFFVVVVVVKYKGI